MMDNVLLIMVKLIVVVHLVIQENTAKFVMPVRRIHASTMANVSVMDYHSNVNVHLATLANDARA
jgi:hypothetical protein